MKRIAIQGYKGCFHEMAARKFYTSGTAAPAEDSLEMVECGSFEQLFERVAGNEADAAVMAIENTVSGGLLPNFELLRRNSLPVSGETYLRIEQNLMALPGQTLEDIREVRTHYMAINQTREFFKSHPGIRLVESEDTAGSAAQIARERLYGVAAVASSMAAKTYGLVILAPGIETYKQNFTRFLILDPAIEAGAQRADKATLCFTLPHKPGSLAQILTILSFYDMNLTRIQSLPIPGHEWEYFFYADIRFGDYGRYRQALSAVRPLIDELRILGEYTSAL